MENETGRLFDFFFSKGLPFSHYSKGSTAGCSGPKGLTGGRGAGSAERRRRWCSDIPPTPLFSKPFRPKGPMDLSPEKKNECSGPKGGRGASERRRRWCSEILPDTIFFEAFPPKKNERLPRKKNVRLPRKKKRRPQRKNK